MSDQEEIFEKRAEFARRLGVRASYVTKLEAAGRLVLSEDCRTVAVHASLARIEETKSPQNAHVADRHAKARAESAQASVPVVLPAVAREATEEVDSGDGVGSGYASARAKKESYQAEMARLDYEERCGALVPIADVAAVISDAVATLRTRIEALPEMLAAQLAPETDESKVRARLAEAFEDLLGDLARSFSKMAADGGV